MSKIIERLRAAFGAASEPGRQIDTDRLLLQMKYERDQARRYAETEQRHKLEYFDLVVRIEKQRDEWREMFKRAAQEYHISLAAIENQISRERLVLKAVVDELNKMRSEKGLEPMKHVKDLPAIDAPPIGDAKRYAESMMNLFCQGDEDCRRERGLRGKNPDRPIDVNAAVERDALREKQASEKP